MDRKSSYINILQFDERLISLLRVRRHPTGVEVLNCVNQHGHWPSEGGALEQALREFVQAQHVSQGRVCTVLPHHAMAARILSLPSQEPEEIARMVRLNAEQYVPYPVEELVIDQCLLEKTPDGFARVLAVFAHRDVVESHLALLRNAGVQPEQIYVSSACLASAAIAALGSTSERYALVNLGSTGLEVLVLNGGRLEFGRGIATVQDWGAMDEGRLTTVEELATEVSSSLSAYRRESEEGREVDKIYLCSDWADVDGWCELLTQRVPYDCAPASFAHSLVIGGTGRLAACPLVALGAALTAQDRAATAIRLESASMRHARMRASLKRRALTYAAFMVAIIAGLAGLYSQAVWHRQAYIQELEQRVAEMHLVADEIIEMDRQLRILRAQVDRSETALGLLAKVGDLAPLSGLNIISFAYDRGAGRITIAGRAESTYQVNQFADNLRGAGRTDAPLLAQARQGGWRMLKERGQDVVQYEIVIPFPQSGAPSDEESRDD